MLFFTSQTSLVLIAISYAFRIIGIALVMMPTLTEGLNALAPKLAVHGNAASSTVRQIAGSIGTAILMMLVSFGTQLGSSQHLGSLAQLNLGYRFSFVVAFLMAVCGTLLSLRLRKRTA